MLKELNELINVRNFLHLSINDFSVNMTSEKSNAISKKLTLLNKEILNMALMLDVEKIVEEANSFGKQITSTKEIKTVEELDVLLALGNKTVEKKVKAKLDEVNK